MQFNQNNKNNPTLFVGRQLIDLYETESTNTYLRQELSKGSPLAEGCAVCTQRQTQGRGQAGSQWLSEYNKNITLSILLKPNFLGADNQFQLNKAISLGVYDFVCNLLGDKVKIKWPNDIYWEDKKLGGILIENILKSGRIKYAIVGIGLNINQRVFPSNVNATSFINIAEQEFDLESCRNSLFKNIENRYLQLKNESITVLDSDYHNSLYRLGIKDFYYSKGEIFTAELTGVSPNGQLELLYQDDIRRFSLKEIKFV